MAIEDLQIPGWITEEFLNEGKITKEGEDQTSRNLVYLAQKDEEIDLKTSILLATKD